VKANLPPPKPPAAPPPPPASPAPAAPAAPHPGARGKLVGAVVAVVVLLLVGGGVWWWRAQDRPPDPPLPQEMTEADVRETITVARAKVIADPLRGSAWGEYGTVLLAHLFAHEAEQCFVEATRLDPKNPRWPYARGHIALKRDPPNAIALLTTAAEAARERPEFRPAFTLTLAEALLERGEVDRAAALFEQERNSPDSARAVFGLGLVALLRGDDAAAAKHFEAVKTNPACRKQASAHLAALARTRGDVPAAKQYEAEANSLDADPPWPDPYLDRLVTLQVGYRGLERRVALLERDGRYEEAIDLYLAQARHKRTSSALTGAAVNMARLPRPDFDKALELLREAVQLAPDDSNAHYTLALVLFNKAEKLWVYDPTSAEAAKGFREVVAAARRATELKPDRALAYMFWGLALKNLGEPKAALEPLRVALSIRPEQFDLHLALGQCLAATGARAAAEACFNTAAKLKPTDPRPAQELAKLKGG
jgi:tetratricopeptide (TPR) repeat protein